jgi:hypothetical protein
MDVMRPGVSQHCFVFHFIQIHLTDWHNYVCTSGKQMNPSPLQQANSKWQTQPRNQRQREAFSLSIARPGESLSQKMLLNLLLDHLQVQSSL